MLNQINGGYTLSNSTKKYFIKLEKAKITIVRDAASASTFMIDASQYYIKNYASEKYASGVAGESIISSLSNFGVACADGVLSSFGMSKQGTKYQYDYGCVDCLAGYFKPTFSDNPCEQCVDGSYLSQPGGDDRSWGGTGPSYLCAFVLWV